MGCIHIKGLNKTFLSEKGESFKALENIDLSIEESEFVCILGPSGCGKSTLLRIMAGLEQATTGEIAFHDEPILAPRKELGMVFQNYSLMPWLSVLDNIALGLRFNGISREERNARAMEYLKMIDMERFKDAKPYELSGGMQQRVAIARAIANEPDVLLMDEPFGALDAYTRIVLQKELLRIWEKHKKTIVFVTHSVDEAIYLADRIIFMSTTPGHISKEIKVNLPRERERSHPGYGALTEDLLALFDAERN